MSKAIPMVEGDALGPPFLNLGDYSLNIERKLNWMNRTKTRQLSLEILKLKIDIV